MSKPKKEIDWYKVQVVIYASIFVLPVAGYLIVNFYWWLFDGNVLNADKMFASIVMLIITIPFGAFLAQDFWE